MNPPEPDRADLDETAGLARRNGLAEATPDDLRLLAAMRKRVAAQVATIRRDYAKADEPAHVFRVEPSPRPGEESSTAQIGRGGASREPSPRPGEES